jgi:hypothetical protein
MNGELFLEMMKNKEIDREYLLDIIYENKELSRELAKD